ncbi:Crp/Fnr family transcriptional regulator [Fulvivirga sp. M361]|uniref:Crp/Fnr family transcriptional regulator n=1 Tax=Fulvivirga sp. M361 TaxID=2594266 RepID=UPI00117BD9E9|nr:Crp/Fnr family transcriptional regulator [Fulvivirga sp. M361]TRX60760.1 Crp/Fnr family transcriptional regulator [Fulvivirga sp. M361]
MQENRNIDTNTVNYLEEFKETIHSFSPITKASWDLVKGIAKVRNVRKGEKLLLHGHHAKFIYYIAQGTLRAFYIDDSGNVFNKNLFLDKEICASKVSLLRGIPSFLGIDALENSIVISIPFNQFSAFIHENDDLKNFYIAYIQNIWIIEREQRELSLVMQNATERYQALLRKHPDIEHRIPLYHVASHIGITPTQLSRIRKEIKNADLQHM